MATTSLPNSQKLNFSGNALMVTDLVVSGNSYVGGVSQTPGISTVTAATLAVTEASHAQKTVVLSKVDGQTITMPAATGSGNIYTFWLGATTTSNAYVFSPTGDDTVHGVAVLGDSTDGTGHIWTNSSGNNTVTLGGTSNATGGIKGTRIIYQDIAADTWAVLIIGDAGGTEATPFSTV